MSIKEFETAIKNFPKKENSKPRGLQRQILPNIKIIDIQIRYRFF